MLLYAMLHLAGVRAVGADEQVLKSSRCPWRKLNASGNWAARLRGIRIAYHFRRGKHDWTTRSGSRKQRGHGHRWQMAAANFNRPNLKYSTTTCTPCARMVISWRESEANGVPGRPFEAVESMLDLRSQPHHIRWSGELVVQRRCDDTVRRYGWNVTRVADANDLAMLGRGLRLS